MLGGRASTSWSNSSLTGWRSSGTLARPRTGAGTWNWNVSRVVVGRPVNFSSAETLEDNEFALGRLRGTEKAREEFFVAALVDEEAAQRRAALAGGPHGGEGDGAVHGSGVEVAVMEPLRELPCHRTFSRTGWTVDRDNKRAM